MDCRMTKLMFRVFALPFAVNLVVRCNAKDLEAEYPQVAKAVFESVYMDDGLLGAKTIEEARKLRRQL